MIFLDKEGKFILNMKDFFNLKNYCGEIFIIIDGIILLGVDDKLGIVEIMIVMEYLINYLEIKYGIICVVFGFDEEIGVGVDKFDVV